MTLCVGPFKVYPCYVKLEEDDSASIFIEFTPDCYGLHLETLYFLCNNNTIEKVEIIGDGVIFEKGLVKVQVNGLPICNLLLNRFAYLQRVSSKWTSTRRVR